MSKGWLENKRIVIIGGTTGIGFSAAKACMEEGASVVIVGRDPGRSEAAGRELGSGAVSVTADATIESTAELAIETSVHHFGGFDALYHVAGGSGRIFGDGPLHEMNKEGWEKTLHWNLGSMMYSNKAALQYFIKSKHAGVILNMASVLGFSPSPHFFSTHAYAAAKSAVIGLSKSIAAFYANQNIRINVIAPALVETPMSKRSLSDETIMRFISTKQPLEGGRVGIPGDLDGATVFLLSDRSSFITGQLIAVDGGWSITDGQYSQESRRTKAEGGTNKTK
jgi:NAD(P)-dependent dehydrogenase (short-subunit alcohol dehydrogenase family)